MLLAPTCENGTLGLLLHDLDVSARAAATLEAEFFIIAYRPREVCLHLTSLAPTPATLSVIARTRKLCSNLGIALLLAPAPTHVPPAATAA